jgi:hypothetical protein
VSGRLRRTEGEMKAVFIGGGRAGRGAAKRNRALELACPPPAPGAPAAVLAGFGLFLLTRPHAEDDTATKLPRRLGFGRTARFCLSRQLVGTTGDGTLRSQSSRVMDLVKVKFYKI